MDYHSQTIPGLLRHWARTRPDAVALREKHLGIWNRITFAGYFERVCEFALGLDALGFTGDDFLCVASENSPEWMYADLATQSLGGACIGIYPTSPWPELKYILEHSRARVVVCGDQEQTDKVLDALAQPGGLPDLQHILCVDMKGMRDYRHPMLKSFDEVAKLGRDRLAAERAWIEARIDAVKPTDSAVIVYTSGTTGLPKGAMLSHRGLIANARRMIARHGLDRRPLSMLAYLPLCHVAEREFSTVMQLVDGTTVSFAESIDTVLQDLREVAPNAFLGVPRIWEKLQSTITVRLLDTRPLPRKVAETAIEAGKCIADRRLANGGRFASVRDRLVHAFLWLTVFRSLQTWVGLDRAGGRLFCGGAPISPEVLRFYWAIGLDIYQIFGMTETCGATHSQFMGSTVHGSCGPALDGWEEKLTEDGELVLRSDAIFSGYLHNEAATREAIVDGWLHSGDIARQSDDGSLFITDRKKDVLITSGGKNITPSLIENRLKDSPYIREAILIGEGRKFLSALIQIDYEVVGKWAQAQGIAYTNYVSLARNEDVRALVQSQIDGFNAEFARVENVRRFAILQKELDHDDGEVTATMKVRRRSIEKKFADIIETIYARPAEA